MSDEHSNKSANGSTPTAGLPYERDFILFMNVISVIQPPLLLFGVFTNSINIVVFIHAGLLNSVNICLFALSVSDLIHLVLSAPQVCSLIIEHFRPDWRWPFDINLTKTLLYWPASTFYDMSAFFAVFLAAIRCACVSMPLRFKSLFDWKRCLVGLCVLAVSAVLLRTPALSTFKIEYYTNANNKTEAYLVLALSMERYLEYTMINDLLNRGIVPWSLFTIIVFCTTVLIYELSKAAKFRKLSSSARPSAGSEISKNEARDSTKMSAKDIQVVQSVILVSVVFILSQVPFLSYSLARNIEPEFHVFGNLQRLFSIAARTSTTCGYINASVNIFIYYNYHTKYRQTLWQTFKLKEK